MLQPKSQQRVIPLKADSLKLDIHRLGEHKPQGTGEQIANK